jgi:hypothetical protein
VSQPEHVNVKEEASRYYNSEYQGKEERRAWEAQRLNIQEGSISCDLGNSSGHVTGCHSRAVTIL